MSNGFTGGGGGDSGYFNLMSGIGGFIGGMRERKQTARALHELKKAYEEAGPIPGYAAPELQQQQYISPGTYTDPGAYTSAPAATAYVQALNQGLGVHQPVDARDAQYAALDDRLSNALSAINVSGPRGGVQTGAEMQAIQDIYAPASAQIEVGHQAQQAAFDARNQALAAQQAQQMAGYGMDRADMQNLYGLESAGMQNRFNLAQDAAANQFNLGNAARAYQSAMRQYQIPIEQAQAIYGPTVDVARGHNRNIQQMFGGVGQAGEGAEQIAMTIANSMMGGAGGMGGMGGF